MQHELLLKQHFIDVVRLFILSRYVSFTLGIVSLIQRFALTSVLDWGGLDRHAGCWSGFDRHAGNRHAGC